GSVEMKQLGWTRRTLLGLCTVVSALTLPAAVTQADRAPVVKTEGGPVRGTVTDAGRSFLGIPYAAPPVGDLRFRAPQPAEKWRGLRDGTQFASTCPQPTSPYGTASTNEDCLYLNVYTPVSNCHGDGLPVMVWLHPGAFQFGEGSSYDPTALTQRDVIVVTLNYRLGAFGFLAHPALTAEQGSSGNYGLQDQQAALRWVQRNIERFGGDPDNVTIFGESAGGLSVHAHLVSPQSAGLFDRAIAQSAAYALTQPTLAQAETQGSAYATAVGCPAQDLACLRSVPVATLLANQGASATAYMPRVDGSVLPLSIGAAFGSGQFNRVPVIEGSTHDEFRYFVASQFELRGIPVTAQNYIPLISAVLSVPLATAQQLGTFVYPLSLYPSPAIALGTLGTDAAFACNARLAAKLLAQYVPVWTYEFSDANAPQRTLPPVSFPYGAYHTSELQYLFKTRATLPGPSLDPQQQQLAESMKDYWAEFARDANPNGAGAPAWAPYNPAAAADGYQSFVTPGPVAYSGAAFGADHKCAVWGSP
ncbi:MAG TPA: carboxylesterase/lipase family protein, partial [Polyangiales bacterium]